VPDNLVNNQKKHSKCKTEKNNSIFCEFYAFGGENNFEIF
jgi:hypothetical protein